MSTTQTNPSFNITRSNDSRYNSYISHQMLKPLASVYMVCGLPKDPSCWTFGQPDYLPDHLPGALPRFWRPEVLGTTTTGDACLAKSNHDTIDRKINSSNRNKSVARIKSSSSSSSSSSPNLPSGCNNYNKSKSKLLDQNLSHSQNDNGSDSDQDNGSDFDPDENDEGNPDIIRPITSSSQIDPDHLISKHELNQIQAKTMKLCFPREVEVIASTLQPPSTTHCFNFSIPIPSSNGNQSPSPPSHHNQSSGLIPSSSQKSPPLSSYTPNTPIDSLRVDVRELAENIELKELDQDGGWCQLDVYDKPTPKTLNSLSKDNNSYYRYDHNSHHYSQLEPSVAPQKTYYGACLQVWSHSDLKRTQAIKKILVEGPKSRSVAISKAMKAAAVGKRFQNRISKSIRHSNLTRNSTFSNSASSFNSNDLNFLSNPPQPISNQEMDFGYSSTEHFFSESDLGDFNQNNFSTFATINQDNAPSQLYLDQNEEIDQIVNGNLPLWLGYSLVLISRFPIYDLMVDHLKVNWARFHHSIGQHSQETLKILSFPIDPSQSIIKVPVSVNQSRKKDKSKRKSPPDVNIIRSSASSSSRRNGQLEPRSYPLLVGAKIDETEHHHDQKKNNKKSSGKKSKGLGEEGENLNDEENDGDRFNSNTNSNSSCARETYDRYSSSPSSIDSTFFVCKVPGKRDLSNPGLEQVDFTMWPIFKSLSMSHIVSIYEVALSPMGRVVFFSNYSQMLNITIESFRTLLELRGWVGMCQSIVHARDVKIYLEDPGPFLLGMNSQLRRVTSGASPEIMMVDIDNDSIHCIKPNPLALTKGQVRMKIEKKLEELLGTFGGTRSVPKEFREAFPAGRFRPLSAVETKGKLRETERILPPPEWNWDQARTIIAFDSVLSKIPRKGLAKILGRKSYRQAAILDPSARHVQEIVRKHTIGFVDRRDILETKIWKLNRRLTFLMAESMEWKSHFESIQNFVNRLSNESQGLKTRLEIERRRQKTLSGVVDQQKTKQAELESRLLGTEQAWMTAQIQLAKAQSIREELERQKEFMVSEMKSIAMGDEESLIEEIIPRVESRIGFSDSSSRNCVSPQPNSLTTKNLDRLSRKVEGNGFDDYSESGDFQSDCQESDCSEFKSGNSNIASKSLSRSAVIETMRSIQERLESALRTAGQLDEEELKSYDVSGADCLMGKRTSRSGVSAESYDSKTISLQRGRRKPTPSTDLHCSISSSINMSPSSFRSPGSNTDLSSHGSDVPKDELMEVTNNGSSLMNNHRAILRSSTVSLLKPGMSIFDDRITKGFDARDFQTSRILEEDSRDSSEVEEIGDYELHRHNRDIRFGSSDQTEAPVGDSELTGNDGWKECEEEKEEEEMHPRYSIISDSQDDTASFVSAEDGGGSGEIECSSQISRSSSLDSISLSISDFQQKLNSESFEVMRNLEVPKRKLVDSFGGLPRELLKENHDRDQLINPDDHLNGRSGIIVESGMRSRKNSGWLDNFGGFKGETRTSTGRNRKLPEPLKPRPAPRSTSTLTPRSRVYFNNPNSEPQSLSPRSVDGSENRLSTVSFRSSATTIKGHVSQRPESGESMKNSGENHSSLAFPLPSPTLTVKTSSSTLTTAMNSIDLSSDASTGDESLEQTKQQRIEAILRRTEDENGDNTMIFRMKGRGATRERRVERMVSVGSNSTSKTLQPKREQKQILDQPLTQQQKQLRRIPKSPIREKFISDEC